MAKLPPISSIRNFQSLTIPHQSDAHMVPEGNPTGDLNSFAMRLAEMQIVDCGNDDPFFVTRCNHHITCISTLSLCLSI